jgi:hypothetical protein
MDKQCAAQDCRIRRGASPLRGYVVGRDEESVGREGGMVSPSRPNVYVDVVEESQDAFQASETVRYRQGTGFKIRRCPSRLLARVHPSGHERSDRRRTIAPRRLYPTLVERCRKMTL